MDFVNVCFEIEKSKFFEKSQFSYKMKLGCD